MFNRKGWFLCLWQFFFLPVDCWKVVPEKIIFKFQGLMLAKKNFILNYENFSENIFTYILSKSIYQSSNVLSLAIWQLTWLAAINAISIAAIKSPLNVVATFVFVHERRKFPTEISSHPEVILIWNLRHRKCSQLYCRSTGKDRNGNCNVWNIAGNRNYDYLWQM